MKAILFLALLAAAGLIGYNYFKTGEIGLIPPKATPEAKELQRLQQQLEEAREKLAEARRGAGRTREEIADRIASSRREVERITSDLESTVKRLEAKTKEKARRLDRKVREKADKLKAAIEAFRRELE